jgi:hypothetical protein
MTRLLCTSRNYPLNSDKGNTDCPTLSILKNQRAFLEFMRSFGNEIVELLLGFSQ